MDECTSVCCGVSPRRTVSELFDRGLRRARQTPLPLQGDDLADANGFSVRFSLAVEQGVLARIGFQASTCATLIAYCELIVELATGQAIPTAARLSTTALVLELPGVPLLKRDRASLAIAAFRNALAAAWNAQILHPSSIGESHEGRLHLRHPTP